MFIYNTLTKSKDELIPIEENKIKLYACGPTVYNFAHIGNLRTYIFEDLLTKTIRFNGYDLTHCMNVTDVGHLESDGDAGEDKMALGAKRENKTVWEIARYYEDVFFSDCQKLNIAKPDITCRATDHIQEMIDFVQILEKKGFTYAANGNIYFDVEKFPGYNKLTKLNMDDLDTISRVDIDENKKNQFDFVLWFTNSKFKNQIMQWDSPWGRGFPGWHLECSAMSHKYLGESIDIHCGGVDHVAVHHTNEIAQSESAFGHEWVKNWMHGEFLVMDDGKMSKSKGEFLTVSLLEEKGYDPIDYRYFCLQSRYRKQLVFSYESLDQAKNALAKLRLRINETLENEIGGSICDEKIGEYTEKFRVHISDDLNIPNAMTVLFDVIKDTEMSKASKKIVIEKFDTVLSLDLFRVDKKEALLSDDEIKQLIEDRKNARLNKDWGKADEVRDELLSKGIELIDSKEGTTWKIK